MTRRLQRLRPMAAVLTALILATVGSALVVGVASANPGGVGGPIVRTDSGRVRGAAQAGAVSYRGIPYAAPPTGKLRWTAPRAPRAWTGVRDTTDFAPSCPQPASPFTPPGPIMEDCLYLNVYTPARDGRRHAHRPVLVWIHGGGWALDAARNYDPSRLASDGAVVVTLNYRLGALGFLTHPALATRPGGPSGNYGLMDQQAALRWVQRNIGRFGGDRHRVTIAGQSAGGLSVLAHLTSAGSRGLFQRAIVQSGSFALNQQSRTSAEAFGEAFADAVDCPNQSAACLRTVPVEDLVRSFPPFAIPGVVDGTVLTESIGSALASGRFARVPVLNGSNHDEERIFVAIQKAAVSGGTFVQLNPPEITEQNYLHQIQVTLGVSEAQAAAIADEYPTAAYDSPTTAFSVLVSDANFACTALQVNRWTSRLAPTFSYEFADDAAPPRYAPLDPPVATHTSELPYLLDLPNAPLQQPLNADQHKLASSMRAAWSRFAATGNPSTPALRWRSFNNRGRGLLLVAPNPHVDTEFSARHHCTFWAPR